MKRFSVFAGFIGALLGFSGNSDAAYPVYTGYQNAAMPAQPVMYAPNNGRVVMPTAAPNAAVLANPNVNIMNRNAASANRVTGQLPRVGSASTNAGRQYYQPSDYDRLADSGLYIGFSASYALSISGGMKADYTGEANAFYVPGAFQEASFRHDTVIPLQLSLGAAINNDLRVDFSYSRYRDIGYLETVSSSDGVGGYVDATATGGAITANAAMLNVYYNIDSYTGYLAGGSLRPYIGAGVGVSLNTIGDYVIYDGTFYAEMDDPSMAGVGELTGISNVTAYHNGGTTENLAFTLEGGVSADLNGGLKMDFFVRYANLGRVKSSGSIVVSQVEWIGTGDPYNPEQEAPYDSVFHYTNWYESGRLGTMELGVRLRLQF